MPLPATPEAARAIAPGTLERGDVDSALAEIRDARARRAMARLIADRGRKYSADARAYAAARAAE